MKRKLEQAQEENDKPIPQDLIRKFKIPKIENIKFIDTINAVYRPRTSHSISHTSDGLRNEVEKYLDKDSSDHPLNLVFSHTSTQFVTIALYITTKDLPEHLLPYLQLYLDSFYALPVDRNGEIIDYEKVVAEVNRIATSHNAYLGVDEVTEVLTIKLRTEKSKYKEAVNLLSELFVHSVFDPERYPPPRPLFPSSLVRGGLRYSLSIEVSKAQNDIPGAKRDGDDMAKDVKNVIQLDERTSSKRATTTLRQETLLNELERAFEDDEETIITKFDQLRAEREPLEEVRC